jgi:hypothetical protein
MNVILFDRRRSEDMKIDMVSLSVNQKITIHHRIAIQFWHPANKGNIVIQVSSPYGSRFLLWCCASMIYHRVLGWGFSEARPDDQNRARRAFAQFCDKIKSSPSHVSFI